MQETKKTVKPVRFLMVIPIFPVLDLHELYHLNFAAFSQTVCECTWEISALTGHGLGHSDQTELSFILFISSKTDQPNNPLFFFVQHLSEIIFVELRITEK